VGRGEVGMDEKKSGQRKVKGKQESPSPVPTFPCPIMNTICPWVYEDDKRCARGSVF